MPLDNVDSQLDLYNTKHTELHLNIYKSKYLKGCLYYLSYHPGKKVRLHNFCIPQIRVAPKPSLNSKSIHFTPILSHSQGPAHIPRPQLNRHFPSTLSLDITVISAKSHFGELCPFWKTTLIMN